MIYTLYYVSINLLIGNSDDGSDQSTDMCVMRAINQQDHKKLVAQIFNNDDSDSASLTARASRNIRKLWHFLSKDGAKQAQARALVENVVQLTLECLGNDGTMDSDSMGVMMDFAGCGNATDMYNCSTPTINKYRTFDSTCNNLNNPLWGAANTAFSRLCPAQYEDGVQQPVGFNQQVNGNPFGPKWPSAREISRRIVLDPPPKAVLTHMTAMWGLFVTHDLTRFGEFMTTACEQTCDLEELSPFCYPILVDPRDEVYGVSGSNRGRCLPLTRSVGECIQQNDNGSFSIARQQLNQVTHLLDGSGIYGSTKEEAASLRSFKCGCLKDSGRSDSNKGNPPFSPIPNPFSNTPEFAFGDFRANGVTAVIILHTIFIREHNRLVRELAVINPCWNDERLFQEARAIVVALVQIITYNEFLPAIYGRRMFDKYIGSYSGYDSSIKPTLTNEFAVAAFRFGHSLLSDKFSRLDSDNNPLPIGPLGLREAFFNTDQYFISGGTDPLLRGLLDDKSRAVDEFVTRVFTTQFLATSDDSLGQDVASRDIQRGRGHGIASYRHYEKICRDKFNVRVQFANPATNRMLWSLYGRTGYREGIDLWVGMLAEQQLKGAQIGPTVACLLAATFKDLRSGDRFWWENSSGPLSASQQNTLAQVTYARVICDNADNITSIKRNTFIPGGESVDCSSLPSLDLSQWKDDECIGQPPLGFCNQMS